jgi:MFS family permease
VTDDLSNQLEEPARGFRAFRAGLGPYGLLPLVLLAGLAAAQSFDSGAFGVLAPEIRHTFHLDNAGIDSVSGLTGALPLLGSVFIGNLGDRGDRVRISRYCGLLWGVTAILTGLAPVLAILVLARLLGGIGLLTTNTIYPSLLTDYYPVERRPQVFTIFLLSSTGLGLAASPLAGVFASAFGWRSTYVVLALPTFIFVLLLRQLREPREKAADPVDDAAPVSPPLNIRQSFGVIKKSPTLRRTWAGAFILGGATAPLATLVSTYFQDVYHVNSVGRGSIVAAVGLGGLTGLAASGALAQKVVAVGRGRRLPIIAGVFALVFAIFVLLVAVSPALWVAVTAVALAGVGVGGFLPPYTTIVSVIAPAELRSQAFAWSTLFYAFGAIGVAVFVGTLADAVGQRTALAALSVLIVLGGVVMASTHRMVEAEMPEPEPSESAIEHNIGGEQ